MDQQNFFIARLPEMWGRGYTAFSTISRQDAINKIRVAYERVCVEVYGENRDDFKHQWEYNGGWTDRLDMNQVYDEFIG